MTIFLIRHGETPGNAARVLQMPGTPLSKRGFDQAERLGARLARDGVGRVLSSDFARAAMTAGCVRDATGAGVDFEPLLQERNFGDLRGTPYAELSEDPFAPDYVPPNGEGWDVFHARIDAAWARVHEVALSTTGNLAVVTHGLVCHSLALRHLQVDLPEPGLLRFGNTALTVLESSPPWRVSLFNCTAHLDVSASNGALA